MPWRAEVIVDAKIALGDYSWFRVQSYRDGTTGSVNSGGGGWIALQVPNTSGAVSYATDLIVCAPPAPIEVTFYYDRQAAAHYARSHTRNHASGIIPPSIGYLQDPPGYIELFYTNQDGEKIGRVTSDLRYDNTINIPYFDFSYTSANITSGTSSARFTSEPIWMGGMPMSVSSNVSCASANSVDWFYCIDAGITMPPHPSSLFTVSDPGNTNNGKASRGWRNHPLILSYFNATRNATIQNPPLSDPSTGIPDLTLREFQTVFNLDVKAGDYIFTPAEDLDSDGEDEDGHGWIITGWGEPVTCSSAIIDEITNVSPQSLCLTNLDSSGNCPNDSSITGNQFVPYVADFSGWIATVGPVDNFPTASYECSQRTLLSDVQCQIQTPASRPFYCSTFAERADAPNTGYNDGRFYGFGAREYRFYQFNDTFSVPTQDLLNFFGNSNNPVWFWTNTTISSYEITSDGIFNQPIP